MRVWRFLDTGAADGARNMAVDEVLARAVAAGESGPVLRLYGWTPPAVSFGYGQRPEREVDVEACRRQGVDLVRRPTGGRAVLHAEELTYSVVFAVGDPLLDGSMEYTYRRIGECLVEGLRLFGVEAALERVRGRAIRPRSRGATLPCFSSIARWELKCRGRKLAGSAQRRLGRAVLQHGSLLLGPAHERLVELLAVEGARRANWARQLRQESTYLGACVDAEIDREKLAGCLAAGFERRLGVVMEAGALSRAEEERARRRRPFCHVEMERVEVGA